MDINFEELLGAEGGPHDQRLTLYVPNKDRLGNLLEDWENWVAMAQELLSKIGGGATSFPPTDGNWVMGDGEILSEKTRIVFCYVDPDRFDKYKLDLRRFLHQFGSETDQGEVIVEFDNQLWKIRKFDEAE